MKKTYKIDVIETITYHEVNVEAESLDEAKETAQQAWESGDLESDDIEITTRPSQTKGHWITLDSGARVEVNANSTSKPSSCRSCGARIYWGKSEKGKNIPLNEGLKTSHFATCPQSEDWRKGR